MSERILIFSGGDLRADMLQEIRDEDLIIGADRGAFFLLQHGIKPDVAIGDFDSVTATQLEQIRLQSAQFITCDAVMKELTDTEMALDWAIEQRTATEILIFGALGSRWDHSLANIYLLKYAAEHQRTCTIMHWNHRISICLPELPLRIKASEFPYVSIIPMTEVVTGIHLQGFKYPLVDATLNLGSTRGISNELNAEAGDIQIRTGALLVIESEDGGESYSR